MGGRVSPIGSLPFEYIYIAIFHWTHGLMGDFYVFLPINSIKFPCGMLRVTRILLFLLKCSTSLCPQVDLHVTVILPNWQQWTSAVKNFSVCKYQSQKKKIWSFPMDRNWSTPSPSAPRKSLIVQYLDGSFGATTEKRQQKYTKKTWAAPVHVRTFGPEIIVSNKPAMAAVLKRRCHRLELWLFSSL